MRELFYKECLLCDTENRPFEYKSDVSCLYCSIDTNDHLLGLRTNLDGTFSGPNVKKLLKRRYHLRELVNGNRIPKAENLERENVKCNSCGKEFVALRINHLKYCGDCTKFKDKMADLVLKRSKELEDEYRTNLFDLS